MQNNFSSTVEELHWTHSFLLPLHLVKGFHLNHAESFWGMLEKLNEYRQEPPKKSLLRGWDAKGNRNIIEELLMYILWAHLFLQRLIKQKSSQHNFFISTKWKGSRYTYGTIIISFNGHRGKSHRNHFRGSSGTCYILIKASPRYFQTNHSSWRCCSYFSTILSHGRNLSRGYKMSSIQWQ